MCTLQIYASLLLLVTVVHADNLKATVKMLHVKITFKLPVTSFKMYETNTIANMFNNNKCIIEKYTFD